LQPSPSTDVPARPPQKSGVVVPHKLGLRGKLTAFAIYALAKTISLTWRMSYTDRTGGVKGPIIICIWHNRIALSMKGYTEFGAKRWPAKGLAALISASKDGALLSRVYGYFGATPVRGSSSRRGRQALLELTNYIQDGFNAAITPDGPKGPKYKLQEGIIALAQITGAPIVPATVTVDRKWSLKSWDGFQIPKPFAKCEAIMIEPMRVPREATEADREALRAELERRMLEITVD
jgi:hypothetical protein